MPTYNFSQISSFEFEELCRDLLQAELDLTLELFAPGPDRGIDIRYLGGAGEEDQTLVAQCKRWDEGAYSSLLSHLKAEELPKIEKLAPTRYLLMTSVRLSPDRKDEIVEALDPWVRTAKDIFGRDDISGLLGRHEEVERRHIKLWLTSTEVLDALLNSDIATRSEWTVERAKRQLQLWVPNPSFQRARELLEETHVCVISGAPGIGKTMLASVLLAGHASLGYEPVAISADIGEAERAWRSGRPQVFHYDDFLGQVTYGQLHLNKNEDSRLALFLENVKNTDDKRFILTTREYILAEASNRYQALGPLAGLRTKLLLSLGDYTMHTRGRILYNHLFFSELTDDAKSSLIAEKKYWDIIRHSNYSPRIVEHVVDIANMESVDAKDFPNYFLETLDKPIAIWDKVFNELSIVARSILLVLSSLPQRAFLEDVQKAVRKFEPKGFSPVDFRSALKALDGTLLNIDSKQEPANSSKSVITIKDPSVRDYLWGLLEMGGGEAEQLIEAAVFFEQCVVLHHGRPSTGASGRVAGTAVVEADRVAAKALELINSPCPRLTLRFVGAWGRDAPSLESRATFLASVCEDAQAGVSLGRHASTALRLATGQWLAGRGELGDGVDLVRQAKRVQGLQEGDEVARAEEALWVLMVGSLGDMDAFEAFVNLLEVSPRLATQHSLDIEGIRQDFERFVEETESWVIGEENDLDWVEREVRLVDRVADALSADVVGFMVDAEARIEELQRGEDAHEIDDEEWRLARSERQANEAETDRMFESLLA